MRMLTRACICLLVIAAAIALSSCGVTNWASIAGSKLPPPAEKVDERLVDANIKFSFKLFNQLTGDELKENIFICPASVAMALTMTYNGADGETKDAMAQALELQHMSIEEVNSANADLLTILQNPDPNVKVSIVNSLWVRKGVFFYKEFLDTNEKFYHAYIEHLDFSSSEAPDIINNWVKERTNGRIDKLIDEQIPPNTVMYLLNALYFKGDWANKFDPKLTQTVPFILSDDNQKSCSMMFQSGKYPYFKGDNFQAVSLPYGKGRISMVVILPDEGVSLKDLCRSINLDNWKSWMDSLSETKGEIGLPKFKVEYEAKLEEALESLGMGVAFDADRANFGKMRPIDPKSNLYISSVKHKAFVETNEDGTKAGGAAAVEMKTKGMPLDRFRMVMDRPFMFVIRDNLTGVILFVGAVVDPGV